MHETRMSFNALDQARENLREVKFSVDKLDALATALKENPQAEKVKRELVTRMLPFIAKEAKAFIARHSLKREFAKRGLSHTTIEEDMVSEGVLTMLKYYQNWKTVEECRRAGIEGHTKFIGFIKIYIRGVWSSKFKRRLFSEFYNAAVVSLQDEKRLNNSGDGKTKTLEDYLVDPSWIDSLDKSNQKEEHGFEKELVCEFISSGSDLGLETVFIGILSYGLGQEYFENYFSSFQDDKKKQKFLKKYKSVDTPAGKEWRVVSTGEKVDFKKNYDSGADLANALRVVRATVSARRLDFEKALKIWLKNKKVV